MLVNCLKQRQMKVSRFLCWSGMNLHLEISVMQAWWEPMMKKQGHILKARPWNQVADLKNNNNHKQHSAINYIVLKTFAHHKYFMYHDSPPKFCLVIFVNICADHVILTGCRMTNLVLNVCFVFSTNMKIRSESSTNH